MTTKNKTLIYTGIGSRALSKVQQALIIKIAEHLARAGYLLRSGGAAGADEAFEVGVCKVNSELREIWIPWRGFRIGEHPCPGHRLLLTTAEADKASTYLIESNVCPVILKLKASIRALFNRNVHQITGNQGIKSSFVIYSAPVSATGAVKGGTRIAVNLARYFEVPTFNLQLTEDRKRLSDLIGLDCTLEEDTC